ncbi:MAG TPA: PLP-dependent aminotransferase family protein [Gammaproteobacteria bacterium]|nr:PLP-dependent aminotransferase family protein [Gammaproteobacteria bacterium]
MTNIIGPLEFAIDLPAKRSGGLLRALHVQLRNAMLDGRLRSGQRLPATRAFAAAYSISRNTVVAAYDLLLSEGYLTTRPGGGTFVADSLPEPRPVSAQTGNVAAERRLNPRWRRQRLQRSVKHAAATPMHYDFRLGVPDASDFRFDIWRRLSMRTLRHLADAAGHYADPQGQPALREAIASHVSFARAVSCQPDDVVVTAGAQQAFNLLARILVRPGRTLAAVEDPGYPPLRNAFAAAGATLAPVPVDDEGMLIERLPACANIVCVTPSHQFPLGVPMSMQRRAALLDFARANDAVIVEDDYDSEFRFTARPLNALQTLDRSASVFYVGTFSKSLFPALRLGFVVTPPWARQALVEAKREADWHCPATTQETLAAFINEGHLARHVRKMRKVYGARRQLLLDRLQNEFNTRLEIIPSMAGLHLAAHARPALATVVERARRKGLGIYPLEAYYSNKNNRQQLAFGYGAIDEAAIDNGLSLLDSLWPEG